MWGHDLKNELGYQAITYSIVRDGLILFSWRFKMLTYINRVSTKQVQSLANSQPITKSEHIPSKVVRNSLFLPEEKLFDLSYR